MGHGDRASPASALGGSVPPPFYGFMRHGPEIDTSGKVDLAVARRAWQLAARYRGRLLAFIGLTALGAGATLVPPFVIRAIIDQVIPAGNTRLLGWLFGAMVGVALAAAVIGLAERWLSASIGESLIRDLRVRLFDHVQRMPLSFFTRTQTGSLITRLNNDVVGAQRALTGTLGSIASNAITVGLTVAAMIVLEWRITLLAILLLPAFTLPARWVGKRLQGYTRESMHVNAEMNTTMTERFNVSGALLVKLFGDPDHERDQFGERVERVAGIGIRTAVTARMLFIALGFIAALATAFVYLIGGRIVIAGAGSPDGVTVGDLVALAALATQIYRPLTELTNARVDLLTALVSFERVFEVLDLPHLIEEREDAVDLPRSRGHLVFERVSFRHPAALGSSLESLEGPRAEHDGEASEMIVRDVSFEARPGEMVALVGPSGAGKTTIAMLVPRIHDVTAGRVLIDGHDVRDLRLDALARAIGMVTQDPHLFHDSIAANLRYAQPDASDEDLEAACRAARIHEVIERLPDGYDTIVGERGYRLSGGEKQRVAIARVILKDPAIVVLDEATAHLDSESERLVQAALRDVLVGRTSLVIAHRLSTIVDADTILVLDRGRVVERGSHGELVALGGLYAELAGTQLAVSSPSSPLADEAGVNEVPAHLGAAEGLRGLHP
jgi:ATP-binding cassette, subfamily B, bacterial